MSVPGFQGYEDEAPANAVQAAVSDMRSLQIVIVACPES